MKSFFTKICVVSIILPVVVSMCTVRAAGEYGIEDSQAVKPTIDAKDLKLPELWQQNVLPQYRVLVAREVVEAARKMAFDHLVKGVAEIKLGDDMTVGTLLGRSDQPDVKPEFFVRGAREGGIIYRQDALVVEITMEVSRKSILGSIKCWLESHLSTADQKYVIKLRDYIETLKGGELRAFGLAAVGVGCVRPEYAAAQQKTIQLVGDLPSWVAEVVRVRGQADIKRMTADQEKARDAAFADASEAARRAMMLKVEGLQYSGGKSVGKFVESAPELKAGMAELAKSVQVVNGTEVIIGDKAEVTVSLDLKKVWNMLLHYRLTH